MSNTNNTCQNCANPGAITAINPNTGGFGGWQIVPTNTTVPTNIITTTAGTPCSTIWPYPILSPQVSPTLDELMGIQRIDDKFIFIRTTEMVLIKSGDRMWPLTDVLANCKNVAYIQIGSSVVITKAVWTTIQNYLDADGIAGLTPWEFLDKVFSQEASK